MANNGGSFVQNTRYGGQSIDTFVGNPGTFDISEGIDIHNALNGITLAPDIEVLDNVDYPECYLTYDPEQLYRFVYTLTSIKIYNSDNSSHTYGTLEKTYVFDFNEGSSINNETPTRPRNAVRFGDDIIILCEHRAYKYTPSTRNMERMEIDDRGDDTDSDIIPALQYHESLVVVGKGVNVFTYDGITGRTLRRSFKRGVIASMILFNENIGVLSNEGHDSLIYVIGGNFDAEDIGILDYIYFPAMSVVNIAQQGGRLFVMCVDRVDGGFTQFYEIRGSTPVLLKETRQSSPVDMFYYNKTVDGLFLLDQEIPSVGNRIIIATSDGVRVYGSPNASIPEGSYFLGQVVNPKSHHSFGKYYFLGSTGQEQRVYFGKDSTKVRYQQTGNVVTRQFFGQEISSKKSMIKIFMSFFLTAGSSVQVFMRKNLQGKELIGTVSSTDNDLTNTVGRRMSKTFENIQGMTGDWNTCSLELVLNRGGDVGSTPIVYEIGAIYEHIGI